MDNVKECMKGDKETLIKLAEEIRFAHMALEVNHKLLVKLYTEIQEMVKE